MKRLLLVALLVSSCSFLETNEQKIAASCAGASASLKALTAANELGKLTPEQQTIVISAMGVIAPICTAENPPTLDDVRREAFLQAIAALQKATAP